MFNLFVNNLPTILTGTVVALGLGAIIWKMIKDRKNKKSSCGCNCANCPSAGMCHTK